MEENSRLPAVTTDFRRIAQGKRGAFTVVSSENRHYRVPQGRSAADEWVPVHG